MPIFIEKFPPRAAQSPDAFGSQGEPAAHPDPVVQQVLERAKEESQAADMLERQLEMNKRLQHFDAVYKQMHQGKAALGAKQMYGNASEYMLKELSKGLGAEQAAALREQSWPQREAFLFSGIDYGIAQDEAHKEDTGKAFLTRTLEIAKNPNLPQRDKDAAWNEYRAGRSKVQQRPDAAWQDDENAFKAARREGVLQRGLALAKSDPARAQGVFASAQVPAEFTGFFAEGEWQDASAQVLKAVGRARLDKAYAELGTLMPGDESLQERIKAFGLDADQEAMLGGMLEAKQKQADAATRKERETNLASLASGVLELAEGTAEQGPDLPAAYMLLAESDLDEATKSAALNAIRNGSFGQAQEPGAVDALRQQILSGQAGQAELATALLAGRISAKGHSQLSQLFGEANGELGPILRAWGKEAQGDAFELGVSIIRQKYEAGGLAAAAPWLASGEAHNLAALTRLGATPSEAVASPDDSAAEGFDADGENGWDALYIDPDTYQLDPERAEAMREVQGWMEKTGMSAEAGWKNSVMGLAIHRELASLPEDMTLTQNLIASLATVIGDLPTYAAGGLLGASAGPTTAASAAFAFTSAARAALIDNIKHGGIKSVGDLKRNLESVIPAAIGGGVEGLALMHGGKLGKKLAGDAAQKLLGRGAGAAATLSGQAAGEVAALTHAGAARRGEFPRPEEYLEAAATILTLKGGHGAAKLGKEQISAKLRDVFEATGVRPKAVISDVERHPIYARLFAEDLLSYKYAKKLENAAIKMGAANTKDYVFNTTVEVVPVEPRFSGNKNIKERRLDGTLTLLRQELLQGGSDNLSTGVVNTPYGKATHWEAMGMRVYLSREGFDYFIDSMQRRGLSNNEKLYDAHLEAIANYEALIAKAQLGETAPSPETSLIAEHRAYSCMEYKGELYVVKITIKEEPGMKKRGQASIDGVYKAYDLSLPKKVAPGRVKEGQLRLFDVLKDLEESQKQFKGQKGKQGTKPLLIEELAQE